jgi:hypothetical protein
MADVLKQTIGVSIVLDRNGRTMYDQRFYEEDATFTESTHQRIVLATNMATPSEVDLSGVTETPSVTQGGTLFLESDRAIQVAVNNVSYLWPLSANGALLLTGTITHLYVQNESTTNQATIELVVSG